MSFFGDIWHGIESAGETVYHSAIEPVYHAGEKLVNGTVDVVGQAGGRVLDTGERIFDRTLDAQFGLLNSGLNILKSPILLIGVALIGVVVVTRLIPSR